MTMTIALTQEYEEEKRHFHSERLLLIVLQKLSTALSEGFFFSFGGYAPD